jgi:hypothetical protein
MMALPDSRLIATVRVLVAVAATLLLAACGGGNGSSY